MVVNISTKIGKLVAAVESLSDKIAAQGLGSNDLFEIESRLRDNGHGPKSLAHQQLVAVARCVMDCEYGAATFHARQLKSIVDAHNKKWDKIDMTEFKVTDSDLVVLPVSYVKALQAPGPNVAGIQPTEAGQVDT